MHSCRYGRVRPATNAQFWARKRKANVERDLKNIRALRHMGWKVLVVWECWTKDVAKLGSRLRDFFEVGRP